MRPAGVRRERRRRRSARSRHRAAGAEWRDRGPCRRGARGMPARPDAVRAEVVVVHGNFRGRQRTGAADGVAAQIPAAVFGRPGLAASVGREGITAEQRARGLRCGGSGADATRDLAARPWFAAACSAASSGSGPVFRGARERRRRTARAGAIDTGRPRAPGSQASRGGFAGPGNGARKVRGGGCRARLECDRSVRHGCRSVGSVPPGSRYNGGRQGSGRRESWRPGTARSWWRLRLIRSVRASSRNRQRPLAIRI